MNEVKKCKKMGCDEPAAPFQVYCSVEHAPYGHLSNSSRVGKPHGVLEKITPKILERRRKVQALRDQGFSYTKTAKMLGISRAQVASDVKYLTLEPMVRQRHKNKEKLVETITNLANKNMSVMQACIELNVTYNFLYYYVRKYNIPFKNTGKTHAFN